MLLLGSLAMPLWFISFVSKSLADCGLASCPPLPRLQVPQVPDLVEGTLCAASIGSKSAANNKYTVQLEVDLPNFSGAPTPTNSQEPVGGSKSRD
jgi:hypothetical protein